MKTLDIIVPCYNEQDCVALFFQTVLAVLAKMEDITPHFMFIDDGSTDETLPILKTLCVTHPMGCSYLSFSRNFGKEAAIAAGLEHSHADFTVIMDVDLQHPPEILPQMLAAMDEGYDCAAACRINRSGEPPLRTFFARKFTHLINHLSSIEFASGATDYRMMTRRMVCEVLRLHERERFTKGLLSWVGFKTKTIPFQNVPRSAGTTKWHLSGLFFYALSGLLSFSATPLRFASVLGAGIVVSSFLYALFIIISALIHGTGQVPGYSTLLIMMMFLGGVIILLLGIIGEYISRLYTEVKHRPLYIMKESSERFNDPF